MEPRERDGTSHNLQPVYNTMWYHVRKTNSSKSINATLCSLPETSAIYQPPFADVYDRGVIVRRRGDSTGELHVPTLKNKRQVVRKWEEKDLVEYSNDRM